MNEENLYYDIVDSPVGPLRLVADDQGLRRICFVQDRHPRPEDTRGILAPMRLGDARRQLREYFDGQRRTFELELRPQGTAFQREVWSALCEIPYGETWSYADVAERIARPRAVRAVGAANGRNPLPIVVPCHRVIGRDGSLVGFGGGLETKAKLLALETRSRDLFAA